MPVMSGTCDGCGQHFDGLYAHQVITGCRQRFVTATEAWQQLTSAVRDGARPDDVASLDRQFTDTLARYR